MLGTVLMDLFPMRSSVTGQSARKALHCREYRTIRGTAHCSAVIGGCMGLLSSGRGTKESVIFGSTVGILTGLGTLTFGI